MTIQVHVILRGTAPGRQKQDPAVPSWSAFDFHGGLQKGCVSTLFSSDQVHAIMSSVHSFQVQAIMSSALQDVATDGQWPVCASLCFPNCFMSFSSLLSSSVK